MEAGARSAKYLSRVVIPADTILTPIVLLGALRKLTTLVLEDAVEALVTELDVRLGDPDLEACVDEDSE